MAFEVLASTQRETSTSKVLAAIRWDSSTEIFDTADSINQDFRRSYVDGIH
jgi:hypothetical protein